MGYHVVNIPWWHWNRLKVRRTRIEYVRMSRYLALMDPRALMKNSSVDLSKGEAGSYAGEYMFKREIPKAHWSWAKPKEARPEIGTMFTEPYMVEPTKRFLD